MASFSDGVIADSVAVLNLELRGPVPSGEANHAARKAVVDQINSDPSRGAIDKLAGVEANIESLRAICWEKDGIAGMPVLDIILERLCTRSMIAGTEQASGGSPLVTVEPFPSNFLETDNWDKLLDDVVEYVLSAYVIIRPEGGRWRIESPLSNTSVVLHDPETFRLVMTLVRPHSGRELSALSKRSCSRLLLPTLAFAGILHDVDKDDPGDESLWDYHDLLFHSRSRLVGMVMVTGAHSEVSGHIRRRTRSCLSPTKRESRSRGLTSIISGNPPPRSRGFWKIEGQSVSLMMRRSDLNSLASFCSGPAGQKRSHLKRANGIRAKTVARRRGRS